MGLGVGVMVGVDDSVGVADIVGVAVTVNVAVAVAVGVSVGGAVPNGLAVTVGVALAVGDGMKVNVGVALTVGVGVAVTVGVATAGRPNPLSLTFCGLLAPSSVKVTNPFLNFFADGGMNTIDIGQLPPADKLVTHPFVFRKNPVPLTATVGADKSRSLLLMNVMVRGALIMPAGTFPKSIFFGVT
jgi:hypothetical protein